MSRRISVISLFCAWLCASGALLDVAQLVAWTRMFAGHAGTESIVAAAKDTFDPGKPCALCMAVSRARQASGQHAPAVPSAGSEKMVLIVDCPAPFVAATGAREWSEMPAVKAAAPCGDVPVPPPRFVAA